MSEMSYEQAQIAAYLRELNEIKKENNEPRTELDINRAVIDVYDVYKPISFGTEKLVTRDGLTLIYSFHDNDNTIIEIYLEYIRTEDSENLYTIEMIKSK